MVSVVSQGNLPDVIYPSVEVLIEVNRRALREIHRKKADQHRVLSRGKLDFAISKAQETNGDLFDKAAVLLTEVTRGHAFASGNRRTAYLAAISFLRVNGERPHVVSDANILMGVREGFYALEEIKSWLKGNAIRKFVRL